MGYWSKSNLRNALFELKMLGHQLIYEYEKRTELLAEYDRILSLPLWEKIAPLSFGVEIEIAPSPFDLSLIKARLSYGGIKICQTFPDWDLTQEWALTFDGSCGYELISPILEGSEGLAQIKKACDVLKSLDCWCSKDCGFHLHVNVNYLSCEKIKAILLRYEKNSGFFNSLLDSSRHYNRHCLPIILSYLMDKIRSADDDTSKLFEYQKTRNCVVNLLSLQTYGTIEFRQHHGTIDYNEIEAWIGLILNFVVETTPLSQNSRVLIPTELKPYYQKALWDKYKQSLSV